MVKTYNHEEKNVSDLIAYVNNSRTHSDERSTCNDRSNCTPDILTVV